MTDETIKKMQAAYFAPVPEDLKPEFTPEQADALKIRMIEAGVDLNDEKAVREYINAEWMRRSYGWLPPEERLLASQEDGGETIQ